MSNPSDPQQEQDKDKSGGPNLILLYSLILLGLLAAMGVAALIVLPFYRRH